MAEETITQAELTEVLADCAPEGGGSLVFMAPPERVAAEIFEEARRNREPEPGAYEDAEGNLYVRVPRLNAWLRVMDDGTTEVRPGDWFERPLRKLVPEPETKPDLEAKLDRITGICRNPAAAVGEVMGPGRHVPGDRLAAAILAVIRGEEGTT